MNTDKDQERTLWEQEDSEVEQEQETSQEPEIASDSDSKKNNIEELPIEEDSQESEELIAVPAYLAMIPDYCSTGVLAGWLGAEVFCDEHENIQITTIKKAAQKISETEIRGAVLVLKNVPPEFLNQPASNPFRCFPWFEVDQVILSDETTLREFKSQQFGNFDPKLINVSFDEKLFHTKPTKPFDHEGRPEPATYPEHWRYINKICGTIAILSQVTLLETNKTESDVRDQIINSLLGFNLFKLSSETVNEVLTENLQLLLANSSLPLEDQQLSRSILNKLIPLSHDSNIGSGKLISELQDDLSESAQIAESLEFANEILLGRKELPIFSPNKGLVSAKALILFLLRESPSDLITWENTQFADPNSLLFAAALSGIKNGWQTLPTEMREPNDLVNAVEARIADTCNGDNIIWSKNLPSISGKTTNAFNTDRNELLKVLEEIAEEEFNKNIFARTLREMKWEDLATTTVVIGDREFEWIKPDKELRIKGIAGSAFNISPLSEELKARIASTPNEPLEKPLKSLLEYLKTQNNTRN